MLSAATLPLHLDGPPRHKIPQPAEPTRRMTLALAHVPAKGIFLSLAALILIPPAMLRAQTPMQNFNPLAASSSDFSAACNPLSEDCAVSPDDASSQNSSSTKRDSGHNDWVSKWLRKVDEARASQPHYVAPIVTTHVLLVQQFRYDSSWQQDSPSGAITSNYGASRGLEIIPTTRLEVALFPPNYLVHQSSVPDGFGDFSYQIKYRAFSAPEDRGDYFVGFFFGGSFPSGTPPDGLGHSILSPTFAAAKGFGPWDIQTTIGANLPASGADVLGRAIIFNTAVDYRIKGKIWPMLEQNSTFWSGGLLDGRKQVFLTPGVVFGSFPFAERLHLTFGTGVQIAVTQFHQFNRRWIVSARFPF
jgi:hypothetical protein